MIRIGISGWRYEGWRGGFYPEGLPQRRELEYAASLLPTIEINGSFYSLQRPEYFDEWYRETPRGFLFAVKGGRYITHVRRLRDVETPLANFYASGLFNLREKLGPFLWQFPPSLRYDPERFEAFFASLPRDTEAALAMAKRHSDWMKDRTQLKVDEHRALRHAIEVRHESFVDPSFVDMLRRHELAWVIADAAGKWPYKEDVTADFVYIRLHGETELYSSGYDDTSLERWAGRIRDWADGREPADAQRIGSAAPTGTPRDIYCYFDNDYKVRAPFDAQSLMRKLDVRWDAPEVRIDPPRRRRTRTAASDAPRPAL